MKGVENRKPVTDPFEDGYTQGSQSAWLRMLQECLRHIPAADRVKKSWIAERTETVLRLRQICAEFGDNEWPDDLHLADVLDKHLFNHLLDTTRATS